MSKRSFLVALIAGLILMANNAMAMPALIEVGDYGDSGWQTFSYTALYDGLFGFVVTDVGDSHNESFFLLDNILLNNELVEGFEDTDYDPEDDFIGGAAVIDSFPPAYSPTEGSKMLYVNTKGNTFDGSDPEAYDTSMFGDGASKGVWGLLGEISAGDTLKFDWAFSTSDWMPFDDYAMFLYTDNVSQSDNIKLASVGYGTAQTLPEPTTLSLLGLGLVGAFFRRKAKA